MIIKNKRQLRLVREASDISMSILFELGQSVKAGIKSIEIDKLAEDLCKKYKVKSAFKEVPGYFHTTCISINDEVLHGIPNQEEPLKVGDIVKIDFGIIYKGIYTDHCWSFVVESASKKVMKLLKASKEATESAIPYAIAGNFTGDIGYQMSKTAKEYGYNTAIEYVGHGIGKSLHDYPDIPSYGRSGQGRELEDGMIICVECQVIDGSGQTYVKENGWTVKSVEGGNAGMYEYMLIVRDEKPEVLTPMFDWPVVIK